MQLTVTVPGFALGGGVFRFGAHGAVDGVMPRILVAIVESANSRVVARYVIPFEGSTQSVETRLVAEPSDVSAIWPKDGIPIVTLLSGFTLLAGIAVRNPEPHTSLVSGMAAISWSGQDASDGRLGPLPISSELANVLLAGAASSCKRINTGCEFTDRREGVRKVTVDLDAGDENARQPIRIETISVQGLRGFAEKAEIRLAQPDGRDGSGLTVVVGPNNAGKSTIWEAIDAIGRSKRQNVSFSENRRNRECKQGVEIAVKYSDGATYTLTSAGPDTSETTHKWEPESNETDLSESRLDLVAVPARRQFQPYFSQQYAQERDWMFASDQSFVRTNNRDAFGGRLIEIFKDDDLKARFDDLLHETLGYRLNWSIDMNDTFMGNAHYVKVRESSGATHSTEGLGEGLVGLLFVLSALLDSETGTLIALDEPELSLHPQLIKRLKKVLGRYAKDRQIILCTHSPILVDWDYIENGAEIVRVYQGGAGSVAAQPERAILTDLLPLRKDKNNPHTIGQTANEIFFQEDRVIVVEGQDDVVYYPIAAGKLGIELEGDFFGWGAGGKDKIERVFALFQQLGLRRVVAILDNDAAAQLQKLTARFPEYFARMIPAKDVRTKRDSKTKEELTKGLLDKNLTVRDEYREATIELFRGINRYLSESRDGENDAEQDSGAKKAEKTLGRGCDSER